MTNTERDSVSYNRETVSPAGGQCCRNILVHIRCSVHPCKASVLLLLPSFFRFSQSSHTRYELNLGIILAFVRTVNGCLYPGELRFIIPGSQESLLCVLCFSNTCLAETHGSEYSDRIIEEAFSCRCSNGHITERKMARKGVRGVSQGVWSGSEEFKRI